MIRTPHLPAITHHLREALHSRLGPEPARTVVALLFVVLMLAFYVGWGVTHFDR